jgi:hypothetical protein
MLNIHQRELIAAALDGPLPDAQDAEFRILLGESVEAVQFFQALQSQQNRLRALPKLAAPKALKNQIMSQLANAPRPASLQPVLRPSKRTWLPHAVAASTLLAVMAGSFWFAQQGRQPTENQLAQSLPKASPDLKTQPIALAQSPEIPRDVLPLPREITPSVAPREVVAIAPEVAPEPRVRNAGDVVGSGAFAPDTRMTAVDIRLPVLALVSEFDTAETRTKLLAEVKNASALRLDLFARDSVKASEWLQATTKGLIPLVVDPPTAERMKLNQPLAWGIYTESLTGDDLPKLFDAIATANRSQESARSLTVGHLSAAQASDAKDLRELLGVDVGLLKRPKPAANSTVNQLSATLGKNAKSGVVFTFLPTAFRTGLLPSVEVRNYLTSRPERTATQVPLLIVIRPLN